METAAASSISPSMVGSLRMKPQLPAPQSNSQRFNATRSPAINIQSARSGIPPPRSSLYLKPAPQLRYQKGKNLGVKRSRQVATRAIAVSPPPSGVPPQEIPEVDILPPQDDSATGWEGLVIRTERRINVALTGAIVTILDAIYTDRHYARFYMLETIARVPYFAYLSVLHVYESFGWWRRADYLKVHFAESWNELHHLLIMEALGGDKRWLDRFLAQHVAVAYYTVAALMYILSPRMAYHLNECVEKHAYHTYDKFVKQFGDKLKQKPAPEIAVKYYTEGDLYMFDEFQTAQTPGERRPTIENLYDVFVNIRNDEAEHCKTMRACQTAGALISPHQDTPADFLEEACSGVVECSVTATSAADRALKHGLQIDDRL